MAAVDHPTGLADQRSRSSSLSRTLAFPVLAALLIAVLLVLTVGYVLQAREIDRSFDARLSAEATALAAMKWEQDVRPPATLSLPNARVTLLRADGVPYFDTERDPGTSGSLQDRPEILQAASHGLGVARRVDQYTGERMHYAAHAVVLDGEVVGYARVARRALAAEQQMSELRSVMPLTALVAVALGNLVVTVVVGRHVRAVNKILGVSGHLLEGEYSSRLTLNRDDELGQLSRMLNELSSDTADRVEQERQTSRRLGGILAGLNEGVVAIDDQQRVVHINDAAYQMLNDRDRVGLGLPLWEAVRVSEVVRAADDAFAKQSATRSQVGIHGRQYDVAVIPLRDADLEGMGVIIVLRDVTELLRLEQVRTEFVANASHELKTPIAAIKGFVETIIDDPAMPQETRERFMARLSLQAARLENLVQELIALSRYDAAREALPLTPVDLAYVVLQAFQSKQDDANYASVSLEYEGPARSLEVQGDSEALAQLAVNLIDNGIKYVEAGGRVSVRLIDVGRHAVLEVEDNGIGISTEEQERVFERFYRVDKARSAEKGGTGLGLAIVKHVVQAHHGAVTLDSSAGRGSLFSVRLPLIGESLELPK